MLSNKYSNEKDVILAPKNKHTVHVDQALNIKFINVKILKYKEMSSYEWRTISSSR